jgi:Na+-driven multidrug efflux pump
MIARVRKPSSYYIKQTLYLTIPIFIESFIGTLVDLFGLHFIAKSETDEVVGGAGLGLMISNILVLSVVIGFQSAFQTLGSQSFGKKDYNMCSIYHWRARILTFMLSILLSVLLFFSKYLFQLLRIHSDVALFASHLC